MFSKKPMMNAEYVEKKQYTVLMKKHEKLQSQDRQSEDSVASDRMVNTENYKRNNTWIKQKRQTNKRKYVNNFMLPTSNKFQIVQEESHKFDKDPFCQKRPKKSKS